MKITTIERKFKYNSISLPDPNSSLSPDAVRDVYAAQYPELASAMVEGPVTSGQVSTWTFVRAVGSKGAIPMAMALSAEQLVEKTLLHNTQAVGLPAQTQSEERLAGQLSRLSTTPGRGQTPITMPSTLFALWG